jgi:thiol-disulfide isomerase/thioredoxin
MRRVGRALSPDVSGGFVALLVALVVAVAGGAYWRLTSGRMRPTGSAPRPRAGSRAVADTGEGNGLVPIPATPAVPAAEPPRLTSEQIGHALGARATLLQFSTAFCAPCRATRRILADVAGLTEGVAHVEIDAESRLDLVRELGVLRTPTVLVLAADGTIVRRASGQPRKPDVIAAIGAAVGL